MYAKVKICRICHTYNFRIDLCLSLTHVRNVYGLFQIHPLILVVKKWINAYRMAKRVINFAIGFKQVILIAQIICTSPSTCKLLYSLQWFQSLQFRIPLKAAASYALFCSSSLQTVKGGVDLLPEL